MRPENKALALLAFLSGTGRDMSIFRKLSPEEHRDGTCMFLDWISGMNKESRVQCLSRTTHELIYDEITRAETELRNKNADVRN